MGFVDDCEELVNGLVKQDDAIAERCEQVSQLVCGTGRLDLEIRTSASGSAR